MSKKPNQCTIKLDEEWITFDEIRRMKRLLATLRETADMHCIADDTSTSHRDTA